MNIELDDNVAIVRLVEGLASVGLTISNDRAGGLRIHNAEALAQVIDLAARRRADAATDAQIRDGMRHLFATPPRAPDPPPPRDVTGRTPPPEPPAVA